MYPLILSGIETKCQEISCENENKTRIARFDRSKGETENVGGKRILFNDGSLNDL